MSAVRADGFPDVPWHSCPDCLVVTRICTDRCEQDVRCPTCDRRKARLGRSEPLGSYVCDSDCPDYRNGEQPPHLWPGELDFHRAGHRSPTQGEQ